MQGEELNMYGELYIHKNPKLKIKVVDGSSLAIAIILNNIPEGTTQVLFRGKFSKVAYFTALALLQKGIQVRISLACMHAVTENCHYTIHLFHPSTFWFVFKCN